MKKHWQEPRAFCREYEKAAKCIGEAVASPSRAQYYRWINREFKGMPHPHNCRVLEAMFPEWTAEQLFQSEADESFEPDVGVSGDFAGSEKRDHVRDVEIFLDVTEEDSKSVAAHIRAASGIFFMAHTGYGFMVNQYQWPVRDAVANGCRLRVVVSDPDGQVMRQPELKRRLCPSVRQEGEVQDVLSTCARLREYAAEYGAAENVQAKVYAGVPTMNIVMVDGWLRVIPYMPMLDAGECPVFEYHFDPEGPSPLLRKFLASMERVWADARLTNLEEIFPQSNNS
ncbi:hypothetical protein [Streptomyces goshikiensis]|uniref:hypothetical protein n=1 Tax=Streptomyces goshikiensis TaxID=1942 RepID=UPI0036630B25